MQIAVVQTNAKKDYAAKEEIFINIVLILIYMHSIKLLQNNFIVSIIRQCYSFHNIRNF